MRLLPKAPDLDATDAELIGKVLDGDRKSFHVLVTRHSGSLWSTVRASLANVEDARDVFQETWLRAFQRLESLRDPGRLRAWLASIALNLVRQNLRRGSLPVEASELLDEEPDRANPGALELVSRAELASLLRHRIAELPLRQRQVMDLRLNQNLSHAEIAELLSIREDASRANFYQGLRKLKTSFDERDRKVDTP